MGEDLLLLGFIPQSKSQYIKDSGVVETLAEIYSAWTSGGGAATVDVNKVVSQLQNLASTRGNLFQIPPYFAYIAKSFSVLEGIGLCNDPNYSIINECLPYVSKRLLTDESERTGGALSTFIFGPNKNEPNRIIEYKRVEQLLNGFGSYTTSASGELMNLGDDQKRKIVVLENAADQILDIVVTEEDTPLQNILIEQLAKLISASGKNIFKDIRERFTLPSGRSVLGTVIDPLGIWRTSPLISLTKDDNKILDTTRNLITLLNKKNTYQFIDVSSLSNEELLELSSILVRKIWDKRLGVVTTGRKLAFELLKVTADNLERGEREEVPNERLDLGDDIDFEEKEDQEKKFIDNGSSRLSNARKLLEQIEKREDAIL